MTEREEIDMLRRLVADLTERVRALEARPALPLSPTTTGCSCPAGAENTCRGSLCPRRGYTVTPFSGQPWVPPPISTCVGGGQRDGATTQRWG